MNAKSWLRAGLLALAATQGAIGVWQYFFTRAFYDDFPTVSLDPPYSKHFLSDVGGLTLALAVVVAYAAVYLEYRLVCGALLGFIVFAVSHAAYHVTHLARFGQGDAIALVTLLVTDAAIPAALLILARLALPDPGVMSHSRRTVSSSGKKQ